MRLTAWVYRRLTHWLTEEHPVTGPPRCDFERLAYEIRPADALLVEGRTRVGSVIKTISESSWTHSALYIGRLHDVEEPRLRRRLTEFYDGNPATQLLVEAVMGKGTILTPLDAYRRDHLRICRPTGLSRRDAQRVIGYAVERLGTDYDVRQLLDLARFMFPYALIPRRWRSTLFEHNAGAPTRTVCSTMMAEAFASVNFPVLPVIRRNEAGELRFYRRNPRLFAPRDFDYSPYFDIIKYPFVSMSPATAYQDLPWDPRGGYCDEDGECTPPPTVPDLTQVVSGTRINLLRRRTEEAAPHANTDDDQPTRPSLANPPPGEAPPGATMTPEVRARGVTTEAHEAPADAIHGSNAHHRWWEWGRRAGASMRDGESARKPAVANDLAQASHHAP